MDITGSKLLFVFDKKKFITLLSIGDIQRAIINNCSLNDNILGATRKKTVYAKYDDSESNIKQKMLETRAECMPVINDQDELVNVLFWEDVFHEAEKRKKVKLDLPVVIMAGGKGSRLKPLTNVLPKPLIPIGEKTILEYIMDRFIDVGCNNFYLSVNYKAEMIEHYFEQIENNNYKIEFFKEPKPLGTAGSLYMLKGKINETFFVSNCDIIIDDEYDEIYNYHKESKNELTIVAALKHYPIPYGTIETGESGRIKSFIEKPELTFQINSGMYILEPHLLDEIPNNEFFHITDLISNIQKRGGNVGAFPVSEKSWTDIGEWSEYYKSVTKYK